MVFVQKSLQTFHHMITIFIRFIDLHQDKMGWKMIFLMGW